MTLSRSMPLVCLSMIVACAALAQAPTPPSPPTLPTPPPYAGRVQHYNMDRAREMERGPEPKIGRGAEGSMGIVPFGTWWKNPDTISTLSLTADQQKKMDDIFRQNRIALIDLKASLDKEQINLEPLLNANPVDSNKALAEISKIADLRAGLEKANAKMLLGLRSLLTADQWTKLQDMQHMHRKGPMDGQGMERRKSGPGLGGQPVLPGPPVQK